jgi:hypothetical protein
MGSAWHTLVPVVQNVQAVQSLRSVQVVIGSRLVQRFKVQKFNVLLKPVPMVPDVQPPSFDFASRRSGQALRSKRIRQLQNAGITSTFREFSKCGDDRHSVKFSALGECAILVVF